MPRKSKGATTPKRLKQKKLDVFLSSSPAPSTHGPSPSRTKRRRAHNENSDDEPIPGPSNVPVGDEDGSQSSDAGAIRFEREVVEVSSDEGEEDRAPRRSQASRKRRANRAHSDDSASPQPAPEEDEPEIYLRKGKRPAKTTSIVLDSDEEEDDRPVKKRKLVKGERPPTPQEDDANLLDEVDEERIIDSRLRTRDKRSAFQKNLEKLKKKKRGEAVQSASSSESEGEEEDGHVAPFAHARPDNRAQSDEDEGQEENEDNFIVEDDNTQAVELPAEFSMNTYQDLLHHFKIVCQLFVHMAVHDADERGEVATTLQNNQYFSVPLKITRRKLLGMRDSLVAGSTWKPRFRKTLDKFPVFELFALEFVVLGCDACHLGGRKSTLQGRVSGDPYDPLTYESITDSEASDSDEGEDSSETKKQFDLGRFCAKRVRTYHQFTHWEYHLFHALLDEVETLKASREGRGFVQVAYANGRQPPEDLKDADAIMDWLDERQIINIQWQEIKAMMENARHLEVKGGRGDDADLD
ncbi:hypothetical protein L226DRAFT_500420 [Lentinus tigrinus ALCF2SS1-7]|uniref:DUF4211 domain-containing protein n=1 Tax=Lentinus tigrinus ALCF2SS1-6 TaxID=1328759 RepID=A0A5C2SQU2_9APHY|nr:hypothetical protein L227DRAFT_648993 [Lentinus tigrinus ALCF2SS1-6]RPD80164.1 hypothetical protein L226DRAFT_500420 [Lentinus tigrinus ALCF2SS1-7]